MTIIGISPVPAVSRTADTLQIPRLTGQTRYPVDRIGAIVDDPTLTAEKKIALVGGLCVQILLEQGHSVAYAAARIGVTEDEALDLSLDLIAYENGWTAGIGLRPEIDQSTR